MPVELRLTRNKGVVEEDAVGSQGTCKTTWEQDSYGATVGSVAVFPENSAPMVELAETGRGMARGRNF